MRQEAMQSSSIQASSKSAQMSSSREETTVEMKRSSASSATAKMAQRLQQEQRQKFIEVSQRASSQQRTSRREEAKATTLKAADIKVKDCIEKKIADIRMQPYSGGQEIREAEAASLRARARILDLERELDEITKRAIMTSTKAVKSAKQMAYEASMACQEEAKAASTKKSRKVIIESSSSIKA